jgi:hypothetical protein
MSRIDSCPDCHTPFDAVVEECDACGCPLVPIRVAFLDADKRTKAKVAFDPYETPAVNIAGGDGGDALGAIWAMFVANALLKFNRSQRQEFAELLGLSGSGVWTAENYAAFGFSCLRTLALGVNSSNPNEVLGVAYSSFRVIWERVDDSTRSMLLASPPPQNAVRPMALFLNGMLPARTQSKGAGSGTPSAIRSAVEWAIRTLPPVGKQWVADSIRMTEQSIASVPGSDHRVFGERCIQEYREVAASTAAAVERGVSFDGQPVVAPPIDMRLLVVSCDRLLGASESAGDAWESLKSIASGVHARESEKVTSSNRGCAVLLLAIGSSLFAVALVLISNLPD